MVDQVKLLTARRAYAFPAGSIRLSALSVAETPGIIQQHFGFQSGSITTPPPTFGEVQVTMPPGLVFNLGSVPSSEGVPTPIRFMHFEPQRIVIDVAGPSSAIDQAFEQLLTLLSEVPTPDGSPVLDEFTETADYSEVSAQLSFEADNLLSKPLQAAAQSAFAGDAEGIKALPVAISIQTEEPSSIIETPAAGQQIHIRAGTRSEERIYVSITGMPTDKNLAWLETLDQRMSQG